jgi:uncharacterized protein with HEPN domain
MPLSSLEYIHHILDEIEYLITVAKDLDRKEFLKSETLKRAFVRSVEIIGEASKKLAPEFKNLHPGIQWKAIAGMRGQAGS